MNLTNGIAAVVIKCGNGNVESGLTFALVHLIRGEGFRVASRFPILDATWGGSCAAYDATQGAHVRLSAGPSSPPPDVAFIDRTHLSLSNQRGGIPPTRAATGVGAMGGFPGVPYPFPDSSAKVSYPLYPLFKTNNATYKSDF
eukprot:153828-Prorocentrum_minimum.AAC.2